MKQPTIIRPQPKQEKFLSSPADIAVYGGAAGGGKSFALLLECLRHINNPRFRAVVFRKTRPMLEQSIWPKSWEIFPNLGMTANISKLLWKARSGATIQFSGLQHEKNKYDWKSAEITLLAFDQLEEFEEDTFWYLLSRNRCSSGVAPYVRACCNPDPDSFLASFMSWWIDQDTGFPIEERGGVIRHFKRVDNTLLWADSPDGFPPGTERFPSKSFTFIPAKLDDNEAFQRVDPGYATNLAMLPYYERIRLAGGNWKVRNMEGAAVQRDWIKYVDSFPQDCKLVRFWDKAATADKTSDWTAGVLMGMYRKQWYIIDVVRGRWTVGKRDQIVKQTAETDQIEYGHVPQWFEEEGGSAGKTDSFYTAQNLAGLEVHASKPTKGKYIRGRGLLTQFEAGNVFIVRGPWNKAYTDEILQFPHGGFDDQFDATSGGFNVHLMNPEGSAEAFTHDEPASRDKWEY